MKTSHVCKIDEEGKIHVRQAFMFDWSKWLQIVLIVIVCAFWTLVFIYSLRKPSSEIQFKDNYWKDKPEIKFYMMPEEKIYSS